MRGALALLLLAAFACGAAAQGDVTPKVVLRIEPFDGAILPLSGITAIPVTVTVDCGLLVPPHQPTETEVSVAGAPAWAQATVSPARIQASAGDCRGTNVTLPTELLVSTTQDAPAFTPAEVTLAATVRGAVPATTTATTLVQAGFFSILDVSGPTIFVTEPRRMATCPMTVTNFGNANTKVFFDVTEAAEGWDVQPPIPVTLEAKQQGGTKTAETVALNLLPRQEGVYVNEVGTFTVVVTSQYALDASVSGDSTTHSCLVTVRGSAPSPAGWAAAPAALAIAVAFRTAFRASRQHP